MYLHALKVCKKTERSSFIGQQADAIETLFFDRDGFVVSITKKKRQNTHTHLDDFRSNLFIDPTNDELESFRRPSMWQTDSHAEIPLCGTEGRQVSSVDIEARRLRR